MRNVNRIKKNIALDLLSQQMGDLKLVKWSKKGKRISYTDKKVADDYYSKLIRNLNSASVLPICMGCCYTLGRKGNEYLVSSVRHCCK